MSVLSTSSWLARRARPPPSAARTASSCCRAAPRATSRFATLTHAISSRKPTAPNSASSVSRTSSTRRSASRLARTLIAAVGVRIFALERGSNRPQLAGRALDRDAGFQSSERIEPVVVAAIEQLAGARRGPHRGEDVVGPDVLEVARHHADDRVRDVVELDRLADDRWIGAELRSPIGIAEDRQRRRVRPIVVIRESATDRRRDAEDPEEIARHAPAA